MEIAEMASTEGRGGEGEGEGVEGWSGRNLGVSTQVPGSVSLVTSAAIAR